MFQVFHSVAAVRAALGNCALTIGKYDGIHLGHQKILRELKAEAAKLGVPTLVILSEPQPEEFFAREAAPPRLNHFADKTRFLEHFGIDAVFCLRFDADTSSQPAVHFVRHTLLQGLGMRAIVVGEDFHFGHKRTGSVNTLQELAASDAFSVRAVEPCIDNDERISSSLIRQYLQQGDCLRVTECLGRPYAISGKVIKGKQLGRQLGYPTANIELVNSRLALSGVFVVQVERAGALLPAVASLGYNPTVNNDRQMALEAFLLDFDGDLYGEILTVHFLHKLRDEMKFVDLPQLQQQIAVDVIAARTWFGDVGP